MKIQRSADRGLTKIDWLTSRHSFSFGDYYNPEQLGYRTLRVINDDIISPGQGFGMHSHRDMEIVSFVLRGQLAHRDSMGHEEVLKPGEVQVMSAGRGIQHSEYNPSPDEPTHLFQIWIKPERRGLKPSYAQHSFGLADRSNRFLRVAGPVRDQRDAALLINQDADVFVTRIEPGQQVTHTVTAARGAWVHVMTGSVDINTERLETGDAATVEGPIEITCVARDEAAELVCFDLGGSST